MRPLLLLALLAGPATAQDNSGVLFSDPAEDGVIVLPELQGENLLEPDLDLDFVPGVRSEETETVIAAKQGTGAILRGLDKLSGYVVDIELAPGQIRRFGKLQITLGECRYPEDNPSGDAFAFLVIRADGEEVPAFQGWMIASSPALNAMDHARYDVWLLRCKMS